MVRVYFTAFFLFVALTVTSCLAADKDWNLASNGTWSTALNWSPNGVPLTTDDVFLGRGAFPQGFLTILDTDATVASLTLRNSSDFDTSGSQMLVNGLTTVGGTGSVLTIGPRVSGDLDGLDTEGLLIQNDGLVSLNGGILELESGQIDILTGGVAGSGGLGGYGTVELVEGGLPGQVFNNSGRLFVSKSQFATGGTLTITNTDTSNVLLVGDGLVDLDGDAETGIVDVDDDPTGLGLPTNLTLVVDAALADDFSGEMQIGRGDAIDMRRAWILGNGDLQLNGTTGTATLRGSAATVTGSSNINVNSGVGAIESNLTLLGGTINVATGTTLRLDGSTNINLANALQLNGTATLHVTGNTSINQSTADFDWDAGGSAVTRVSGNGMLTLNVDNLDVGNDDFDGRIELDDDGDLSVTVADNQWNIASGGSLVKNNAGLSSISGSRIVDQGSITVNAGILEINPQLDVASASVLTTDSGATAQLDGTTNFLPGSLLLINGTLNLNGAATWNAPALVSGTGTIINDGGATIAGSTTIGVNTLDWDSGPTTILPNQTLTLNVTNVDQGNDTFNGETITVNSGTLDVNVADSSWTIGSAAELILANTAGTEPALNGDQVVVSNGGSIRVTGGDADINAPVKIDSGSEILIDSPLTLQIYGATTLNGGNITEAGGVNARVGQFGAVTVRGDSSINVDTYNWDQAPTTIEAGGSLTLNVSALDVQPGERYDHALTLNSGDLTVNNSSGEWTVDDQLTLNNTTGTPANIFGATLNIGDGVGTLDAKLTAGGSGASEFETDVTYHADADVLVASGALLRHKAPTVFLGGGEFTGAGTLDFAASVDVNGATTIDMTNGTVDLDGPLNDLSGSTISVNAPLALNVATLSPFGKVNLIGENILDVDHTAGGTLTVNLTNPSSSWQVTPNGQVNLTSNNLPATLLAGSDVDMDGQLNVTGDVIVTSRLILGGDVNLDTAGQPLRLEGGTLTNPNRIDGGMISGPGILAADTGHGLHGFGSISTDVEFSGNAQLKARDGELLVIGAVVDVGEIGTSDVDGVLNMANAWNSNIANTVRMAGGEIRGGNLTNDAVNGIRGHGRITARVINNSRLVADGQTLILDNSASDYDGAGAGTLDATNGNLEIRDDATFGFTGTALVGNNHNAFVNGFRMNFNSGSMMQLNEASWLATAGMNLAGTLTVNGGGPSTIDTGADLTFVGGSNTTLVRDLMLHADPAIVQGGATFTGGGDLVNLPAGTLQLNNGAVLGTGIHNEGLLELGNATARADAADLIQAATGSLNIDLAGTGLNDFDRLVLTGGAQLGGELSVTLRGGFSPTLGDSFSIITAGGGVTGTFLTESLPSLSGGLALDVVYNPTSVLLQVIQSLSPDFNLDGNVNGADVDLLVMEIVAMTNSSSFDLTADGLVNNADLSEWLSAAGAINLPSGNSYLYGDANLDGVVDGSDFITWNSNKFTSVAAWTHADFNADGSVDGSDFIVWNSNKFTSADGVTATVPEPSGTAAGLVGIVLLAYGNWRTRRAAERSRGRKG